MKKCSIDLITGFLSSGKTSFINHILNDFSKEEILIIQCESGKESLFTNKFNRNVNVKYFSSMDEMNEEDLIRSIKFYAPRRILIECNGAAETKVFIEKIKDGKLKEYLKIGLIVNLIDMTTFNMFLKNIPSMIIPNISLSNLIVLNKCNEISPASLKEYKEMIGRFNPNAHIINCISKEERNMNFNKDRLINRMMG